MLFERPRHISWNDKAKQILDKRKSAATSSTSLQRIDGPWDIFLFARFLVAERRKERNILFTMM